jgi:hypothetical protein
MFLIQCTFKADVTEYVIQILNLVLQLKFHKVILFIVIDSCF